MTGADTIVAQATAAGRGGVALIRLSGPEAFRIASRVLHPWPTRARTSALCDVRNPATGEVLDESRAVIFPAPRSYTGEDVVEITTHGGLLVPSRVVAACIAAGAREAEPGEFTRRAVLNGKMDIVQAEAVGDLIDAKSSLAHAAALAQLRGGLSNSVAPLREQLLHLEGLIAYDVDFADSELGASTTPAILEACDAVARALDVLRASIPAAELIRDGVLVVIVGAPNVGKSSLFNSLVGHRRAIVTEIPGTTRDVIEAFVDVNRWPVRLADTAGLRESTDLVETLGIEMSREYVTRARLVLACGDSEQTLDAAWATAHSITSAPCIAIRTKADLVRQQGDPPGHSRDPLPLGHSHENGNPDGPAPVIAVSVVNNTGLDALRSAIGDALTTSCGDLGYGTPVLVRARHRSAVETAHAELVAFRREWVDPQGEAVIAAGHLRGAVTALEEMMGAVDVEEILGKVFGTFCVGK